MPLSGPPGLPFGSSFVKGNFEEDKLAEAVAESATVPAAAHRLCFNSIPISRKELAFPLIPGQPRGPISLGMVVACMN